MTLLIQQAAFAITAAHIFPSSMTSVLTNSAGFETSSGWVTSHRQSLNFVTLQTVQSTMPNFGLPTMGGRYRLCPVRVALSAKSHCELPWQNSASHVATIGIMRANTMMQRIGLRPTADHPNR
jgi:hypothetical protein